MATMTRTFIAALAVTIAGTANAFAPTQHDECDLIPPNAMYFATAAATGIDEKMFNKVIDEVEAYYKPIFKTKGATFKVERKWKDGTVNAYATQNGSTWMVTMFGGLARHVETTPDAFAAVVCHEIGHHIGGQPRYDDGTSWASAEGQSDYFATAKCLRRVFEKGGNWLTEVDRAELRRLAIDPTVDKACTEAFGSSTKAGESCVRSSAAGLALARLLASLGGSSMPKYDTPDKNKVKRTDEAHPEAQCRLDTYFAGAVCGADMFIDFDEKDAKVGACNAPTVGYRPACWYAEATSAPPENEENEPLPRDDEEQEPTN
jgi:hypothetical protein